MSGDAIPLATLQQIPAFRNLSESECGKLAQVAQHRAFAPGEKIIEQGQSSQHLWILLEGKCQVVKNSSHDGPVVLAELEPRHFFGEMSFFSPAPHSANVVAKTQVQLLSIERTAYDELIRQGEVAAYKLAYNVVESVAARLRRMDEWVAELSSNGSHNEDHPPKTPEWKEFRNKLFGGWNL